MKCVDALNCLENALLDHPNGVLAFGRLVGVVNDFAAAEDAYTRLLGPDNVKREQDRIFLSFGEGADVELITEEEARSRGDAHSNRGLAYLASATLLVRDVQETEKVMTQNGIRFERTEADTLRVNPADACGAHLYFKQA